MANPYNKILLALLLKLQQFTYLKLPLVMTKHGRKYLELITNMKHHIGRM